MLLSNVTINIKLEWNGLPDWWYCEKSFMYTYNRLEI